MSFWSPSRFRAVAFLAGLSLLASPLAHAQSASAVRGTLFDQSGAVIPAVSVGLYSERRVLQTRSDSLGKFAFEELEPGTYTLEATKTGFQGKIIEPLEVKRGDAKTVSLALIVAPTSGCVFDAPVSYEEKAAGGASIIGAIQPGPPRTESNVDWRSTIPPYSHATIDVLKAGSYEVVASTHPDASGKFQFTGLTPGEYVLKAKFAGYNDTKSVKFRIMREDVVKVIVPMAPNDEVTVCM